MEKITATNLVTRKAIVELEKASRKRKENVWEDLAKRIKKPRRIRPSVNLWKLEKLSQKNLGKILIVPGKVLGKGILSSKASIAALEFSETAKKAIVAEKGEALSLIELLEKKTKPSNVLIVK